MGGSRQRRPPTATEGAGLGVVAGRAESSHLRASTFGYLLRPSTYLADDPEELAWRVIDSSDPELLAEQAINDASDDETEEMKYVVRPGPVLIIGHLLC